MKLGSRLLLVAAALFGIGYFGPWFSPKATSPALPTETGSAGGPAFPADTLRARQGSAPDRNPGKPGNGPTVRADAVALTEPERRQALAFERVLASRDDNAPEMDRELRELSPAVRTYLRARYSELPREHRNDQGTIVFLIARAPRDRADYEFLRHVVGEAPCLSLIDCARPAAHPAADGDHHSSVDAVTLSYPQLVALDRIGNLLTRKRLAGEERDWARAVLEQARVSRDPRVAEKGRELAEKFSD